MDGYGSRNSEDIISVYRFLQRLFVQPDEEFYGYIKSRIDELNEVGIKLGTDTDLNALQTEYSALFLGPKGHSPPYESVFQERRLWGDSAADVKKLLGRLGLKISEGFNMPPDHIAVELEILEKLLVSDYSEAEELYRSFFEDHILWICDFLAVIIPKSNLIFYTSSFKFASQFLTSERKWLTEQAE